jgi:SpoVK/Ycf46/Vps4 family AAA+-type ATPase
LTHHTAFSHHLQAYLQQFLHEAKLAAPSVVLLDQIDLLSAPRHKAAGITELQVTAHISIFLQYSKNVEDHIQSDWWQFRCVCAYMQVASVLLETLDDWHRSYQEASDRTAVHGVVVIATSLSMTALDPSLLLRGRLEVRFLFIHVEILPISVRVLSQ